MERAAAWVTKSPKLPYMCKVLLLFARRSA